MRTLRPRTFVVAFLLALTLCGASRAEEISSDELQSRVRSIFVAKCSECHGRGLSRPRAALYLNELGTLAANRVWVVPHEPEKSYLWDLLRNDDMPAKGAKAGPLNAQEKETVRAWIAAGRTAPPPSMSQSRESSGMLSVESRMPPSGRSPQESIEDAMIAPPALATRLFAWLGRFHVLVIHFPIALLAAAALAEAIAAWRGSSTPSPVVRFCVPLAAAGGIAAVALGWLHADMGGFGSASGSLLALHRWLGTTAGFWTTATAAMSERESRRGLRTWFFRIVLWSGACVVAAAAHFGGLMVHGSGFYDF